MNKKQISVAIAVCILVGISLYAGILNRPATVDAKATKQEVSKPSCSPNTDGCGNSKCDDSSCYSTGNTCTPSNNCSETNSSLNVKGANNISDAALQSYGELMKEIESSVGATSQPSSSDTKSPAQEQNTTAKPASTTPIETLGTNYKTLQSKIFELTNVERQKNGLPALIYNTTVEKYAINKSQDMAVNNYFDHKSPANGFFYDIWSRDGFKYSAGAENIYYMSDSNGFSNRDVNVLAKKIVDGWMNSESHRQNILSTKIKEIGVGVAGKDDRLYATQLFYMN